MPRHPPTPRCALLICLAAAPLSAQQAPQFRADVTQTGEAPFMGTMYFGGQRMRIEGTSDGEPMTMIIDRTAGRMLMLMPDDRMYMVMDLGSMPFSAPGADTMDPSNPCSSGELTACENLGTESVNGRTTRKWAYTRDGARETVWIANDLQFPVRIEDADGAITDFTNVVVGSQPAALFEPPSDYTPMQMPGFGRGVPGAAAGRGAVPPGRGAAPTAAGRGQPAGRGQAPAGAGRGAPAGGVGGVDPAAVAQLTAQLQAMGLPPDQIAMAIAQLGAVGTVTDSAPWEAIEAWVLDFVVTVEGSRNETRERVTRSETYSAQYTASVPIPYGTPAVGAAVGPAWQFVPGLGSAAALALPVTASATQQYHGEIVAQPAACNDVDGGDGSTSVTDYRGGGEMSVTDQSPTALTLAQARFEISGDLSTYTLGAGVALEGTEQGTTTVTYMNRCPGSPAPSTETTTRTPRIGPSFNITGQPLPGAPGTIRGSARTPIQVQIGDFSGEVEAEVEWTLRPIS
jgi:hypothetical protein